MVQTVAVSDAEALNDSMFAFLLEDADAFGPDASWWHPRVRLIEQWLKQDASRISIPDDGSEEVILHHIQRGDIYPHAQLKCWKHIVLELQDLPCFATQYAESVRVSISTSPSRGKIRPGKELITLADEATNQGDGRDEGEPSSGSDDGIFYEGGQAKPETKDATGQLNATNNAKPKFSSLSMIERQAEWLRKKQEKMEAERCRQEEEKEKELTFQPKILRRVTLGEKPTGAKESTTSGRVPLQRSDTGGSVRKIDISGGAAANKDTETTTKMAGPKEKAIPRVPQRSAGRSRKKQFVPVSQPIEISSELLDTMKSELHASISKSYTAAPSPLRSAAPTQDTMQQDANTNDSASVKDEDADATKAAGDSAFSASPEELSHILKSWSDRPRIGGRRIDFDSSDTKARLVLQDASKFALASMYRKTDKKAQRDGVALHMGRREDNFEEEVIAVLFDKEKVSELEAARWWSEHEHRFAEFIRELPSPSEDF
uniref:Uncharacterized protein n=1 Tax=Globisporangium ultimum (strain ATCC 200006 / CBS 805.95 / DAOM BR144) TaxID=431595 RepID=K3WAW9_GLOUD